MSEIEQEMIDGNDASFILNSRVFKDAVNRMHDHLESRALSCDTDNKDLAHRIIVSKQLLAGIVRELQSIIELGEIHQMKLNEMEPKKRIFSRF